MIQGNPSNGIKTVENSMKRLHPHCNLINANDAAAMVEQKLWVEDDKQAIDKDIRHAAYLGQVYMDGWIHADEIIKELRDKGYLVVPANDDKKNHYFISWDKERKCLGENCLYCKESSESWHRLDIDTGINEWTYGYCSKGRRKVPVFKGDKCDVY